MRYWPEISFRYSQSEVNRKEKGKVNIFPRTTNTGSAVNFARCTRVLRKSDSCPGEKPMNNMSAMQNSSSAERTCSTREPSWAEDFIDLSEFCQPSTILTRMEDSVDECISSPVSSTVRTRCFENGLDGNEGLDPSLEETLWYIPSPNTIQEELCDPISDWLAATKETMSANSSSSDNLLPSSRTEISYNLNDLFLSPRLTSVPNATPLYDRKSMTFGPDDSQTPPLQPDTTFFHSSTDSATTTSLDRHHQRCGIIAGTLNDSLLGEPLKSHNASRLPPADLLFKEKQSPPPPQPPPPPLPPITALASASTSSSSAVASLSTTKHLSHCTANGPFQLQPQQLSSRNQFLECETEMAASGLSQVTVNSNVSFPCSVQSPSITQSSANNSNHENSSTHPLPSSSVCPPQMHRATRPKLEMTDCQPAANTSASSCPIDAPEMLNPLVNKNTEFDLVSYVFEDNKPSVSFDLPNLPSNTRDDEQMVTEIGGATALPGASAVTIKTEPKDESQSGPDGGGIGRSSQLHHTKRKLKDEEDADDESLDGSTGSCGARFKRSRRFSNCSSEDLTQLESEKYRELRNKNNEASRRSRANRKNREVEMREHAFKLDAENRRLKFKAEEMEKLVKRLRSCLMQLVLKRG